MESLIAGLLEQFEDGKLTRRQLIQSLAMAAAAVAPGGLALAEQGASAPSQIPPAKNPAPWKTVYLDHISYAVSDYRKSTAFYRDLMGWQIVRDNNQSQCTLNIGTIGQVIIRNNRQPAAAPAGTSGAPGGAGQANRPPLTGVINHISWGVQPWDTDKVKAELERRGLNPRPDMVGDNFKSFHVYDPDGWDLQISNQTKQD
ncbi:MAG TPA: VOC family protein [Vicinamibacterales bacterium]|nr:VOC family protein [Vicinamibacterales bacterium]